MKTVIEHRDENIGELTNSTNTTDAISSRAKILMLRYEKGAAINPMIF